MLGSHKTATGLTTYKFIQCTLEMPFERETNIQFALKGHITHINHEVGAYTEELAARDN